MGKTWRPWPLAKWHQVLETEGMITAVPARPAKWSHHSRTFRSERQARIFAGYLRVRERWLGDRRRAHDALGRPATYRANGRVTIFYQKGACRNR